MSIRGFVLGAALVVSVCATGCKGKVGDKCSGAGSCQDARTALVCGTSSRLELVECKGPDGCSEAGGLSCDFRGNAARDKCINRGDAHPQLCTPDKKARVQCVKGLVERDECDGPQGCTAKTEQTMACDRTMKVGGSCADDGDWCSGDTIDWLQCKDGKLIVAAKCRGPKHCRSGRDRGLGVQIIQCDVSVSEANDPCIGSGKSCTADKTALLACTKGHMQPSPCGGGHTCHVKGEDSAECE